MTFLGIETSKSLKYFANYMQRDQIWDWEGVRCMLLLSWAAWQPSLFPSQGIAELQGRCRCSNALAQGGGHPVSQMKQGCWQGSPPSPAAAGAGCASWQCGVCAGTARCPGPPPPGTGGLRQPRLRWRGSWSCSTAGDAEREKKILRCLILNKPCSGCRKPYVLIQHRLRTPT